MFDYLFGFQLRLGRLHFFLCTIAVAVVMTLICLAIAAYAFEHTPRGMEPSPNLIVVPALCVIPFFLWVTVNLQGMRFRDIGWNPAYVIPIWVLIMVADAGLAVAVPSLSIGAGHRHGTILGGLVNFVLSCALVFWPSGPETPSMPRFSEPRRTRVEALDLSAAPAMPMARPAPKRTGFGRRGV